jgi:hypothetical protein
VLAPEPNVGYFLNDVPGFVPVLCPVISISASPKPAEASQQALAAQATRCRPDEQYAISTTESPHVQSHSDTETMGLHKPSVRRCAGWWAVVVDGHNFCQFSPVLHHTRPKTQYSVPPEQAAMQHSRFAILYS